MARDGRRLNTRYVVLGFTAVCRRPFPPIGLLINEEVEKAVFTPV
jgi:hypothetical protein